MRPAERNIRKAYAFGFLSSFAIMGGVLVPFFTDWGKVSFAEIMVLQIWFVGLVFILEVPTGTVADYFGRKTSVAIGSAVGAAGHLVYASVPNFWIFAIGEFLMALGCSLISGAEDALLYDSLKEAGRENESKKIFGNLRCASLAGLTVAAPLGSVIAGYLGLRAPMFFEAAVHGLGLLVALSFYEPLASTKEKKYGYGKLMFSGLKHLMTHRTLRFLSINGCLVFGLSFILIWLYQPVLKDRGVELKFFGFFHLALSVMQMIVTNNFARLEKLAGSGKRYWFFCVLSSAAAFIVLALVKNVILTACCFAVISGFGISRWAFDQNYMQKYIESYNRATVLSAVSMMRSAAKAVSYIMAGVLMCASLKITLVFFGVALVVLSLVSKIEESYFID